MAPKTRKNVLLTKPIKVLRDTFMRLGHIGFTDLGKLSKWLDSQRRALESDEAFWRKLYHDEKFMLRAQIADEVAGLGCATVLKMFAEKAGPDRTDYEIFVGSLPDPVRFFIRSLDFEEVSAYYVDARSVAFVSSASPGVWALCMEEADDFAPSFHPVDEAGVFDAVLYAWNSWRSDHEWEPSHLCVWMAMAMDELRVKAGIMFDEAVAVSQDGKRVQAADVVVAYAFDAKKRLTFSVHRAAEFKERKIALGRIHAFPVKPTFRKKTDEQRVQDALKPRAVRKYVVELESHACHQAMLVLGKQRILFTPTETLPKQDSAPPAEPLFPRHENPFPEEPPADPNDMGVLDGIAPSPFEESPGGLTGPAFDGPDRVDDDFDMNAPVYYGPLPVDEPIPPLSGGDAADAGEKVDCVDPAQKPPQRIEIAPPAPDAMRDDMANNDKPKS